jgi:hypothetical protein
LNQTGATILNLKISQKDAKIIKTTRT